MKHFITILLLLTVALLQAQQKVDFSQFYPDATKNPGRVTPIQYSNNEENYDYDKIVSVRDLGQEIGQAFKVAGATSIGVGIPSLLAGVILLAVGYGTPENMKQIVYELKYPPRRESYSSNEEYNRALTQYKEKSRQYNDYVKNQDSYACCATAGCVLLPIGTALTIAGIPLYVKGQHLLDLKIDYTGNGAGLALAW